MFKRTQYTYDAAVAIGEQDAIAEIRKRLNSLKSRFPRHTFSYVSDQGIEGLSIEPRLRTNYGGNFKYLDQFDIMRTGDHKRFEPLQFVVDEIKAMSDICEELDSIFNRQLCIGIIEIEK